MSFYTTGSVTVLAVSDCRNHRIQKFTYSDSLDISPLAVVGKKGDNELEFNLPRGLTFTSDGSLVICDSENHRVQIISRSNKFIRTFGEKGSDPGQFNETYDVAVRVHGIIVIIDRLNHRVQCFTMDGQFTATLNIADNQFPRGHHHNWFWWLRQDSYTQRRRRTGVLWQKSLPWALLMDA